MNEELEAVKKPTQEVRITALEAKAVQDEKTISDLQAAVKAIPPAPVITFPTPTSINILDLGCKLNDAGFKDNAAILSKAFQEAFVLARNTEFYFPGGALFTYDSIVTPVRTGLAIRGNAPGYYMLNENSYWSPKLGDPALATAWNLGGPVSRIVYCGPDANPAIRLRGSGTRIDGLTLQSGYTMDNSLPMPKAGTVGILIEGANGIPTSKTYFPSLSIFGFDQGIRCSREQSENNADTLVFGLYYVIGCRTAFRCENWQSIDHCFQHVQIAACETVFDYEHGGGLVCNNLEFMNPWGRYPESTALRLGEQRYNPNTCYFYINALKIDGAFNGWNLLKTNSPLWGKIRIDGLICISATSPGAKPVDVYPGGNLQLEIDMAYGGLTYDGTVWPPTTTKNKWGATELKDVLPADQHIKKLNETVMKGYKRHP